MSAEVEAALCRVSVRCLGRDGPASGTWSAPTGDCSSNSSACCDRLGGYDMACCCQRFGEMSSALQATTKPCLDDCALKPFGLITIKHPTKRNTIVITPCHRHKWVEYEILTPKLTGSELVSTLPIQLLGLTRRWAIYNTYLAFDQTPCRLRRERKRERKEATMTMPIGSRKPRSLNAKTKRWRRKMSQRAAQRDPERSICSTTKMRMEGA